MARLPRTLFTGLSLLLHLFHSFFERLFPSSINLLPCSEILFAYSLLFPSALRTFTGLPVQRLEVG